MRFCEKRYIRIVYLKVSKGAKIRNRYNQIPHLTRDTNGKVTVRNHKQEPGAQWLSGRVLDSRPKGRGFEPHLRHCVVSLSKNINPSLVLVQPRKTRPFITEKLLMGRKETNQTKTSKSQEVSPFPAGDHKAHINRRAQRHSKHKTEQKHKRSTKEVPPWNGQ